ncbi:MAG: Uma2 family endonuclease [Lachnospiraceae bacterium]|nr:Uma2 family endonuclease [Lachnospiraceae bacterium]
MGKDYTDTPGGEGKIQGVGDGAPAYQAERFLQLVPEPEKMATREYPVIYRQGDKTLEDYLALPEERRVEMIDGVFYDMATPTLVHQIISDEIRRCFGDFIKKNRGKCIAFTAPADVRLFRDDRTVVQPDVFVVCDRDKLTMQRVQDAPDLIVEVVSPGSLKMDTRLKLEKYKQAGVREYWIVFPEERKVQVYLFEMAGEAADIAPKEYTFADRVPVGIWDDRCEVDFGEIYKMIQFLYEKKS